MQERKYYTWNCQCMRMYLPTVKYLCTVLSSTLLQVSNEQSHDHCQHAKPHWLLNKGKEIKPKNNHAMNMLELRTLIFQLYSHESTCASTRVDACH